MLRKISVWSGGPEHQIRGRSAFAARKSLPELPQAVRISAPDPGCTGSEAWRAPQLDMSELHLLEFSCASLVCA